MRVERDLVSLPLLHTRASVILSLSEMQTRSGHVSPVKFHHCPHLNAPIICIYLHQMNRFCVRCGAQIPDGINFCGNCGTPAPGPMPGQPNPPPQPYYGQPQPGYQIPGAEKKVVAGILGILLGSLGIHKFYLGYTQAGIIQLVIGLCTVGISGVIGLVEGIIYLTRTDQEFVDTYVIGRKEWF
jgi:TM2 domain-containing membrane protein YozV